MQVVIPADGLKPAAGISRLQGDEAGPSAKGKELESIRILKKSTEMKAILLIFLEDALQCTL